MEKRAKVLNLRRVFNKELKFLIHVICIVVVKQKNFYRENMRRESQRLSR